jgi:hypothetical protein
VIVLAEVPTMTVGGSKFLDEPATRLAAAQRMSSPELLTDGLRIVKGRSILPSSARGLCRLRPLRSPSPGLSTSAGAPPFRRFDERWRHSGNQSGGLGPWKPPVC